MQKVQLMLVSMKIRFHGFPLLVQELAGPPGPDSTTSVGAAGSQTSDKGEGQGGAAHGTDEGDDAESEHLGPEDVPRPMEDSPNECDAGSDGDAEEAAS